MEWRGKQRYTGVQMGEWVAGTRWGILKGKGRGGAYLVCTMAISGLTPPHLREPLLSRARLGQSIAAHSAWGMELHLIQLGWGNK